MSILEKLELYTDLASIKVLDGGVLKMSELKPVKTDVPVAMIFFNRPEQLKKVFETVKNARPSKLFLIQDGPRVDNENDIINIKKCREVVDEIGRASCRERV